MFFNTKQYIPIYICQLFKLKKKIRYDKYLRICRETLGTVSSLYIITNG